MNTDHSPATPETVSAEIQRRPHVFMRLAENALMVAESLRGNYFKNTATFIADFKRAARQAAIGRRDVAQMIFEARVQDRLALPVLFIMEEAHSFAPTSAMTTEALMEEARQRHTENRQRLQRNQEGRG